MFALQTLQAVQGAKEQITYNVNTTQESLKHGVQTLVVPPLASPALDDLVTLGMAGSIIISWRAGR